MEMIRTVNVLISTLYILLHTYLDDNKYPNRSRDSLLTLTPWLIQWRVYQDPSISIDGFSLSLP